jgi:hypothetical protein
VDDTDLGARLDDLESRLRAVEDRAAITQVIASYGPAADSCDGETVRSLFTEDGTYELEGWSFTYDTMDETVLTDLHLRYVAAGSAHVMSLPHIVLEGDQAVAINYSFVFIAESGRFVIDRTAANRWDMVRTGEGWKVRRRVNRLTNGTAAARALLAGEPPPPAQAVT